jgi:hypothetical protein
VTNKAIHIRSITSTGVSRALLRYILCVVLVLCATFSLARAQTVLTLSSGATLTLTNGAVLSVSGITVGTGATLTQTGTGTLYMRGDWINNGIFIPGTGLVLFQTSATQTIGGLLSTTFFNLELAKLTAGGLLYLDQNVSVSGALTLTQGTLRFLNTASRSLTLAGGLNIPAQTTVDVQTGGSVANTVLTGAGNTTIEGAGATTNFSQITLNKSSQADTVRVLAPAFSVPSTGFLTLVGGTLRLSGSYTLANPVFTTANYSIPANAGLWIDNANVSMSGRNGSATLDGLLRISTGAVQIGTSANQNHLLYSSGSKLTIEGGSLTVTGRLSRDASNASSIVYSQTSGIVTVGTGVISSATDRGVFDIGAAGSSFTWTGGTIEVQRPSSNTDAGGGDFFVNTSAGSVTSGTLLRLNAVTAGQNLRISTLAPVGELLMTGTNNPTVTLVGHPLAVLGNLTIAGNGVGRLNANGRNIAVQGNWINNGSTNQAFTPSTSLVTLYGGGTQLIRGTFGTSFYHLTVNKIGSDTVRLTRSVRVDGNLRLLTNTVVDIDTNNLTIGSAGNIYTDNAAATNFGPARTIYSARSTSSGFLYREIAQGAATPYNLLFPIGTPGTYTPAELTFLLNKATFNAGAFVGVKAVPQEHPSVERNNISLRKYWVVTSANISMLPDGANMVFYYNSSEPNGNEGSYVVLYFSPSYPSPAGFWRIDPGQSDDVVDFNSKLFYSQQVDQINGDWTAGEADAGAATYFSRANGDYNTPSTWSKINFNGPASTTAPNKRSDKVRIQGHTVTVSSTTASANLLTVEQNATLRMQGNTVISGDTMRVMNNARLEIGHRDGIVSLGSTGAVQTVVRDMSPSAVYVYNGTGTQLTGNGLPSPVRSVIMDKAATDTLRLNQYIAITDSLVINNGILDIDAYSIDGNSAGRTFTMRNGELIVRSAFPNNYTVPSFTSGTITFNGTGNTTIPSSLSTPGVAQYNNLRLSGQRNGVYTLEPAGQIRIAGQFDLSALRFTGALSQRFVVDGSTVVFNGTGNQNIPCRPLSPPDSIYTLAYYNLIVAGSGTKQLSATTATTFVVVNDLTIQTNSTLSANGFNLELQRNWVNAGGIFVPGTNSVIFRSTVPLSTTFITSRSTTDNPFRNVLITGQGNVRPLDDMLIQGNLSITTSATLAMTTSAMTIYGNWYNQGNFTPGTSTVVFNGFVTQYMTRATGSENFYNLTVQNTAGLNATSVGATSNDGVIVSGTLQLIAGNLITRGRYATALGPVVRTGSSTPGHVDGSLRKPVAIDASSILYEVGYGSTYTPVTLAVNGAGGTAGEVAVVSDIVNGSSSPIADGLLPTGSGMNDARHVRRQWGVTVPSGSSFSLGANRSYDVTFTFVPPGDLRGGADPLFFEARMWSGSAWVGPNRFSFPRTGVRTASTTQMRLNKAFGTFTVGEPTQYSFYSIVDGNWSTPANWSTQDYGGVATTIQPTATANVYIGDSKTITLDGARTITSPGVVTVDSSGLFLMQSNILSGTGTFRLEALGALGIGHAAGITASGATGNVQTSTRLYNAGTHNRGHFIYTDGAAQASGNGLPGITQTLTIWKTGGAVLTMGSNIAINDSLYVRDGALDASSRTFIIGGNMRVNATATVTPQTSLFTFSGITTQTVTATGGTLGFNNLTISKPGGTGNLVLSTNTNIQINGTLLFAAGNAGTIDARTSTSAYVTALGTVTRTGTGHVDGQLRKNVLTGTRTVVYEVGAGLDYTPYTFQLTGNTGTGTAGILSMTVIPGKHPYLDDSYISPIDPERYIPRYWRLTKPAASTFVRGPRTMTVTLQFIAPNDLGTVDGAGCVDMAYWKGLTERWQPLYPNTASANYNAGYGCGDSRLTIRNVSYSGSPNTVQINAVDTTLASTETLADGSLLLGEFVTGNQNSIAITTYYSRQSGNWNDPNTWSTVSYNGPAASGYPRTQYDIVMVGNGRRVQLNENIGTSWLYSDFARNQFYGPAVTVEATGTLSFGSHVLRGVTFTAKKSSTLEIGAAEGLAAQGTWRGNLFSDNRSIEDSINVVYTTNGYTPSMSAAAVCRPNWDASNYYIEEVELRDASNAVLMNNNTGNTLRNSPATFYFADKSATFTAGQQYTIAMDPRSGGGTSNTWQVWIDYNLNGVYDFPAERVFSSNGFSGSNVQTATFTVPATADDVLPGVTTMRVVYRSGSSGATDACSNGNGEAEDYTIRIVKESRRVDQVTGTGIPNNLQSFEVNSTRAVVSTVQLGKNINVRDSVKLSGGLFDVSSRTISLSGDFINNVAGGFLYGTSTLEFINAKSQTIRGSVATTFNNFIFNKTAGGRVLLAATSATVLASTTFSADNIFAIATNSTLTFGPGATVTSGSASFSNARMMQVSGIDGTSLIQKQFTTAAGAKTFLYPIGIDTVYNPAYLSVTGTYTSTPVMGVRLYGSRHPQRLANSVLKKYWNVTTSNISAITASSLQFSYAPVDTSGDASRYIPAQYQLPGQWEINVGTLPKAVPSPIVVTTPGTVTGDWTAGSADGFFIGRIFYSRNTGNWNLASNWSNIGHGGVAASYYPGQLYVRDTVLIDGHTITLNADAVTVDSLQVGGPFNGTTTSGRGILTFGATPLAKLLNIGRNAGVLVDGRIDGATPGGRRDTLRLRGAFSNSASAASTAGIFLQSTANDYTALDFQGTGTYSITGEGVWGAVAPVIINKTGGLADTLINRSASFATATGTVAQYSLALQKGILRQQVTGATLSVSYGATAVQMQSFTGFDVWAGSILSSSNIVSNVNTTIRLNGGTLRVGDGINEHLYYKTGTTIDVVSGNLIVAGCLLRDAAPSTVTFLMSTAGTVRVLTQGNTDPAKIGFDISNSASAFSMSGGRVIVASGTSGANVDYNVSASGGTGMTGGELQTGDSTITTSGTTIRVVGTMPVRSWHSVGNGVISQVSGQSFTVTDSLRIDDNHIFRLRGNTLNLGGNLTNYGTFDPTTGSTVVEARLLVANGSGNQLFFNEDVGGMNLYNFRLEKPAGTVTLASGANSGLIIRNTLEFAVGNVGVIDARTNGRFVEVSTDGTTTPQILRNGLGHVNGRLYRTVGTGAQSLAFAVGTSASVTGYTPAVFETVGSGGTAGLVGIITYGTNHPQITAATVQTNTNIQRYWNVTTASGFALGANRTYTLTTQFLNPLDLRNSPNILFFEHHLYSPACPDLPASCPPGTGTWSSTTTTGRTDTTVTSQANNLYGDFIIAEPAGFTFYSIANGSWDNPATWSMVSYTGPVAPRIPNQATDIVRIGNGRRVTVPSTMTPQIRAVYVERFNTLPGELYIDGNLGYIRGLSFVLEDGCTLGMQHLNGIAPNGTVGAIQMDSRNFGVSRFVYNSIYGGQNSGRALPDSIAALIVDNASPNVNTLYITNYSGAPAVRVRDTILVDRGTFSSGGRNLYLYGDMVMRNNGIFTPLASDFIIAGNNQHRITLDNTAGVTYNNLELTGGNVLVTTTVSSATAQVRVDNRLLFSTSAVINTRMYDRRVVMSTGATIQRPYNVGFVDGTLRKPFSAGAGSVLFEIGNGTVYTPATLTFQNSQGNGTAGSIDAINMTPVPPEPFVGNRMDLNIYVPRYWHITEADGFTTGSRTVNVLFGFPASEAAPLTLANTVIRRRSIPAQVPLWQDRRTLTWNTTLATVELDPPSLKWNGLGDFFIGQKAQRIFYSRNDGPWDDPNSWSFFGHDGPPVPAGEYPNPDWTMPPEYEFETRDSVIIGNKNTITLNTLPELAYVEISSSGTLVVDNTRYLSASSLGTSAFVLRDAGNLNIKSGQGIESGMNGIIRFNDSDRLFGPAANYEFSGALTQYFGGAFPTTVNNVTINTDNNLRNVFYNQSNVAVNGTMNILRGTFLFDNENAAGIPTDHPLTLNSNLLIATGATFTVEGSGTATRTHTLTLNGNAVNNGNWIMCPVPNSPNFKAETIFSGAGLQTITGSGGVTRLYGVTLDKGNPLATVDCAVDIEISRVGGSAMTYTNGTWDQSAGTLALDGCAPATTQTITANGALHLTGSGNLSQQAGMVLNGGELLLNTTGQAVIGTTGGHNLVYENSPNNRLTIVDGDLTVAGRVGVGATPGSIVYTQSGGTVVVGAVGINDPSRSTFDIGTGSSFTMSDGSLVLRNANTSNAPGRPADFTLNGTVATSGGTVQFGDTQTSGSPIFDYNVLASAALWNISVSSATATLRPRDPDSFLRLQGNLINDGTVDATQTRSGAPATTATVVFQGSGAADQSVLGNGSTTLQNLTMNRGAGSGVVEILQNLIVAGILDLREGSNPNNQIIELPSTTANLIVRNCAPGAVADAGTTSSPYRYIRTDNTGGQLIRTICPNGVYVFPVGSFDGGQDNYTPATFTSGPTGTQGTVGVRVSRGDGAQGGHEFIQPNSSDYLQRYWAVDNVTTTIPGQWRFEYVDGPANITGNENNFTRVGRWNPPFETPGGSWATWNSTINPGANYFESLPGMAASDFRGDWTVGGNDVFRRIFYSLMTGNWSSPTSWTFSPTHSGPIAGPGLYPGDIQDSVVIGGGTNGVNNHVISLDINATVGGLALGTTTANTGTLLTNNFVLSGNAFTMGDNSTLGIGSTSGIVLAPAASGNIRTTVRGFSTAGNYVYNGTASQQTGDGLPAMVRSVTVSSNGPAGNSVVTLTKNTNVTNLLAVMRGTLDMQTLTINNVGGGGNFVLATNATISLGGSNTLNTATTGYASYAIDVQSTVEFYGNNQVIPGAPNAGIGYGNVLVSRTGQKFVNSPVLIRSNLTVATGAYLENQAGVNSLQVLGIVRNDGTITNSGLIEIGN